MPQDPDPRDERDRSARDLLSDEELRELLSPLDGANEDDGDPVLLLTAHPEDVEPITSHLRHYGVRVVPASHCDTALDLFRQRPYRAFISDPGTWWEDSSAYLRRVRGRDPHVSLCFICDPSQPAPAEDGLRLERPLTVQTLEPLALFLHLAPEGLEVPQPPPSAAPAVPTPAPAPPDPPEASDPGSPRIDPLLAVQSFLEVQDQGRGLEAGLRRWAERDPGVIGIAVLEPVDDETQWQCLVWAPDGPRRRRVLEESGELFEVVGDEVAGPLTHGPFYLFQDPEVRRRWIAVRCVRAEAGALQRLAPLFSLISGLRPAAGGMSDTQLHSHFVEILALRMRLAADQGSGLGLLVIETTPSEQGELEAQLRSVLRGSDWMAASGDRVHAILDAPTAGVFRSLAERLRRFPGGETRRMVGLGWRSPGDDAKPLVARAEALLRDHPMVPLYYFQEADEA